MTISKKMQTILAGSLAVLAVGIVPAAQAAPPADAGSQPVVCNEATATFLGDGLVATDGDPAIPARYQTDQGAMPGKGKGLVNAAAHSPALSICADPAPVSTDPFGGDPFGAGNGGLN